MVEEITAVAEIVNITGIVISLVANDTTAPAIIPTWAITLLDASFSDSPLQTICP